MIRNQNKELTLPLENGKEEIEDNMIVEFKLLNNGDLNHSGNGFLLE